MAKKLSKSTEEFDRRFDEGEDIHNLIDMTEAKIVRRITELKNLKELLVCIWKTGLNNVHIATHKFGCIATSKSICQLKA